MKRRAQTRRFSPPQRLARRVALRRGLTLFEVLLSLAILVGSLAAIGQLISNGGRGAVRARLLTQAVFLAESQMAELVAGSLPLTSTAETSLPDDASWTVAVTLSTGPNTGVYSATVTAKHQSNSSLGNVSYSLTRLVRDPSSTLATRQAEAERLAQEQETASLAASQSTGGGNSSSGSAGGSGGGGSGGSGSGGGSR